MAPSHILFLCRIAALCTYTRRLLLSLALLCAALSPLVLWHTYAHNTIGKGQDMATSVRARGQGELTLVGAADGALVPELGQAPLCEGGFVVCGGKAGKDGA